MLASSSSLPVPSTSLSPRCCGYLARNSPEVFGATPFPKSHLIFVDALAEVVALFGIGYGMAAKDLNQYWPFLAFGGAGKVLISLTVLYYRQNGLAANFLLAVAGLDAFQAYLFYRALKSHAL